MSSHAANIGMDFCMRPVCRAMFHQHFLAKAIDLNLKENVKARQGKRQINPADPTEQAACCEFRHVSTSNSIRTGAFCSPLKTLSMPR